VLVHIANIAASIAEQRIASPAAAKSFLAAKWILDPAPHLPPLVTLSVRQHSRPLDSAVIRLGTVVA